MAALPAGVSSGAVRDRLLVVVWDCDRVLAKQLGLLERTPTRAASNLAPGVDHLVRSILKAGCTCPTLSAMLAHFIQNFDTVDSSRYLDADAIRTRMLDFVFYSETRAIFAMIVYGDSLLQVRIIALLDVELG